MSKRSPAPPTSAPDRVRETDRIDIVPVLEIGDNPRNPRQRADVSAQLELNLSVKMHGVLEPLIVRRNGHDGAGPLFELVAGERRLIAARSVGLELVPAVVKDLTDEEAFELATVENVQRADMHPLDEAEAYQAMRPRTASVAGLAARVGKTESHVYRRLKLLALEKDLREALREDRLSLGHAEALLRLAPAQRKIAADPTNGVVWAYSPLLEGNERKAWIPQREDLRPLHDLEEFIRDKSTFDPLTDDARHFQPGLAEQLDALTTPGDDPYFSEAAGERHVEEARANVVLLSDDPLVKSRLNVQGRAKSDPVPLSPTYWRETKAKACPHARPGVVVHGGAPRAIEVCTKRSCPVHWPVKKAPKKPAASAATTRSTDRPSWEAEQQKAEAARKAWQATFAAIGPVFGKHVVKVAKFNAAAVRMTTDTWTLKRVADHYGVTLSESTAAAVLMLARVETYDRARFLHDCKAVKFDLAAAERALAKPKTAEKPAPARKAKAKK